MQSQRQLFLSAAGTKIIMKLDVKNAHWLSERVRERIMLMVSLFYLYVMSLRKCQVKFGRPVFRHLASVVLDFHSFS